MIVHVGKCRSGNVIERMLYINHIFSQKDRFLIGSIGCNHGCLLYMLSEQEFMDELLSGRVRFEERIVGDRLDGWRDRS